MAQSFKGSTFAKDASKPEYPSNLPSTQSRMRKEKANTMHDLDTIVRLNNQAAEKELAERLGRETLGIVHNPGPGYPNHLRYGAIEDSARKITEAYPVSFAPPQEPHFQAWKNRTMAVLSPFERAQFERELARHRLDSEEREPALVKAPKAPILDRLLFVAALLAMGCASFIAGSYR